MQRPGEKRETTVQMTRLAMPLFYWRWARISLDSFEIYLPPLSERRRWMCKNGVRGPRKALASELLGLEHAQETVNCQNVRPHELENGRHLAVRGCNMYCTCG